MDNSWAILHTIYWSESDWLRTYQRCRMIHVLNRIVLRLLPKRTLTTWIGRLTRHPVSRHAIPWYIRHYRIDVSEAEFTLHQYTTLVDFFCRRLRPRARHIACAGVSSPVDGTVSEFGRIHEGQLLQAKGSSYSLAALLGSKDAAKTYQGGDYITLYLSPRDYHRIHMPTDGTLIRWAYIPGSLYPVNSMGVRFVDGLFTKNERVITHVIAGVGRYAVVKVGATIVGSIRTPYGPEYRLPKTRAKLSPNEVDISIAKERGEELGWFEFGSTVILVFAKGVIQSFDVQIGQSIQMGQRIADTVTVGDDKKDI